MTLQAEIRSYLDRCLDETVRQRYEDRLATLPLTRDEGMTEHFCTYFLPYDQAARRVLIGDHKKSGLWLVPGGHIDAGETLRATLNREIAEELGVEEFFTTAPTPFVLTVTDITRENPTCKTHFDLWFLLETDGTDFAIDYTEYHEVRWVPIDEAVRLTSDPANRAALARVATIG